MQNPYESYVALKLYGVTRGETLREANIVVLQAEKTKDFFPVLMDHDSFDAIHRALRGEKSSATRLLFSLAGGAGLRVCGVRLFRPQSTHGSAVIDWQNDGSQCVEMSANVADAILVAHEANSSIYVSQKDFVGQKSASGRMALRVSSMSDSLLREAMDMSARDDNFEMAAMLRDELRRREELQNHSDQSNQQ